MMLPSPVRLGTIGVDEIRKGTGKVESGSAVSTLLNTPALRHSWQRGAILLCSAWKCKMVRCLNMLHGGESKQMGDSDLPALCFL